jgi:hypothetical protein
MPEPSRTFVNDGRALTGYGDTRDQAFNDLLEKLKTHEKVIECEGACLSGNEICRPFLNPPDYAVKFRVYWRKSNGQIRWKCEWGPGMLEFECTCSPKSED